MSEQPARANDPFREETDDPLVADRRNFFKVELWTRDGQHVDRSLFAGKREAPAGALDDPTAESGRG